MTAEVAPRPTRWCGWALALVGVALLAVAASAQASTFRRLAPSVVAFASDGARYVAWQTHHGAPIAVFDTRTDHQATHALPPGCGLVGERERFEKAGWIAAAGRFLVDCREQQLLLSAATGATRPLPALAPGEQFDGYRPEISAWASVGARYLEGYTATPNCLESTTGSEAQQTCTTIALFDIDRKTVSYRSYDRPPDLDRPGAPAICTRLLSKVAAKRQYLGTFAYGNGVLVQPAFNGTGDLRLERCDGHSTLLGGPGEPENFDPRGRLLTWDTGHGGEAFENGRGGTLFSYAFAAHKRQSWSLPRLLLSGEAYGLPVRGAFGFSTHTNAMVFWIGARHLSVEWGEMGPPVYHTDRFSVYAARL